MQPIDMITALTFSGIVVILVLYVTVVYKKGWLKGTPRGSRAYFLCPNSKCRKVFKEPVWITDLSKKPPESFQSCPHCGTNINLQAPPSFIASPSLEIRKTPAPSQSPKLLPAQGSTSSSEKPQQIQKEIPGLKTSPPKEATKPVAQTNVHPEPQKLAESKPTKPLSQSAQVEASPKPASLGQKREEAKPFAGTRTCSHYLGYVRTLPKNTPIPEECMWCTLIVKCLTGSEKIEA